MSSLQIYAANSTRTDLLLLIGAIYYQLGNYEQVATYSHHRARPHRTRSDHL